MILADSWTWFKTLFNEISLLIENLSTNEFINTIRLAWYYVRDDENSYKVIVFIVVIILVWLFFRNKK